MTVKPSLLIPVENQVRELDAKLLLACVAAMRGYPSVIGPREEITRRIPYFPKSLYLSKGMAGRSARLFQIVCISGHEIVAWDEEALVHLPPEIYFSRRLSAAAMKYVSHLFAWGEDNAALWRQYPALPAEVPIHVTGNPRGDLLRTEIRSFYEYDVEKLRKAYGEFILINTNFNHVNAFYPNKNLFQPVSKAGEVPKYGAAAEGMPREYAEGLRNRKQALFEDFKKLIPAIERAFHGHFVILRPHPSENQEVYNEIASTCERVRVTNEGNVVPWLMASKVLVHNGCTTGVEAFILGVPAITYRVRDSDAYDFGFYRLPNMLSHQCLNFGELKVTIQKILDGKLRIADGSEQRALIDNHISAQSGLLACQRIVDVIEDLTSGRIDKPSLSLRERLNRWCVAKGLRLHEIIEPYFFSTGERPEFLQHRYPEIAREEIEDRVSRFKKILGYDRKINVEKQYHQLFQISV
jgi:surface carbohydrate biosynthesis protein